MEINSSNQSPKIAKIIINEENSDLFKEISLGVIIGIKSEPSGLRKTR